jgi:ferredoxin
MTKRKVIKIDYEKCNGCGDCIPNCPEGALQIIDGKARLVSDLFCDGLGACLGHCPQGAITIEERQADKYDERKVMEDIVTQGEQVIKAHLAHLKEHGQTEYLKEALAVVKEKGIHSACPGARIQEFGAKPEASTKTIESAHAGSELRQWPVQLALVPAYAPYLNNTDLLIAADCVPFAYAAFHQELLEGKALLVGCPKLDDLGAYREKLRQVFEHNTIKSVTYAHMEVPCCFGLSGVIKDAIADSGKTIPLEDITIGIQGERKR